MKPPDAASRLAEAILRYREQHALSQRALAKRASVSYGTILRLEHGENTGFDMVVRVGDAIGRPLSELVGEDIRGVSSRVAPLLEAASELDEADIGALVAMAERLRPDVRGARRSLPAIRLVAEDSAAFNTQGADRDQPVSEPVTTGDEAGDTVDAMTATTSPQLGFWLTSSFAITKRSAADVAGELDVDPATVERWFHGEIPSVEDCDRLASLLRVDPRGLHYLAGYSSETQDPIDLESIEGWQQLTDAERKEFRFMVELVDHTEQLRPADEPAPGEYVYELAREFADRMIDAERGGTSESAG